MDGYIFKIIYSVLEANVIYIYLTKWDHGNVNGKGYYKANDGSYYDGEWINSLMEGYGEYYDSITGSKYKGN